MSQFETRGTSHGSDRNQKRFVHLNHLMYKQHKRKIEVPVTICIAAICEGGVIFGAADRMKTAGDVQFEPEGKKIFGLTSSVVAMTAGDAAIQVAILKNVYIEIRSRIEKAPNVWLTVNEIADIYQKFFNLEKQHRAENEILAPLGLTTETFISRQKEMSRDSVKSINNELINFEIDPVGVILAGVDQEGGYIGAHLYTVEDGDKRCWDTIGFAALGYGGRHAESQFMLAQHGPASSLASTLLLTYSAKKRAEVAPGVGSETDLIMIGPQLGTATTVVIKVQDKLEKTYQTLVEEEEVIHSTIRQDFKKYVDEIRKLSVEKPQTPKPDDKSEPNGGEKS